MSQFAYPLLSFVFFYALLFFSSQLTSINALRSSYQLFLWALYGVVFLLSTKKSVSFKLISWGLLTLFVICSFFFIGHTFIPHAFPFLNTSPYQFILRIGNEHNHLGDFAGLIFVSTLLSPFHLSIVIPTLLISMLVMAISFSKSAFLSAFVALGVIAFQKKGRYVSIAVLTLIASLLIVSIYTKEFSRIKPISSIQKSMTQILKLNPKPLLSVRDHYFPQVVVAWKTAPLEQLLFGVGPGNYIYPSLKTGSTADLTPTETHNILMSLIVENGFLTFFWFLVFCVSVVYLGIKSDTPYIYLFLYLLINFQTDFTYAIPFFMSLFFFFSGQSLKYRVPNSILIIFLFFTLISGLLFMNVHNQKNRLDAQLKYAWKKNDVISVQNYINKLEAITPYEEQELVKWASMQEGVKNIPEAVRLLEKLSVYSPRWYLLNFSHQLELQTRLKLDLKKYLKQKKSVFAQFNFSPEEKIKFNTVCILYSSMRCID